MPIRDLIPWNRGRDVTVRRAEEPNPFLTLHREMNRLFDDVFRGFDLSPFGSRMADQGIGWPNIEIGETAGEVTVTAELPGLGEKDVDVQLVDGVLIIRGEKKSESEDKDRLFSANAITGDSSGAFPSTASMRRRSARRSGTGC
jgi:HSP20 family protein